MKTKKIKPTKNLIYPEAAKRWMSWKEWDEYQEELETENQRLVEEADSIVEAIFEFIEEEKLSTGFEPPPLPGERRTPFSPVEYPTGEYYEGLSDFLKERGFNRKNRASVTQSEICAAWQVYRTYYPFKSKPLPRVVEKVLENKPDDKKFHKHKLWGFTTSSIIMRLAKDGLDFGEIKDILTKFHVPVKDTTIRGQIWCAKQRGKYGLPANLNPWQMEQLLKAL